MEIIKELPYIDNEEELESFILKNKPCILSKKFFDHWPANQNGINNDNYQNNSNININNEDSNLKNEINIKEEKLWNIEYFKKKVALSREIPVRTNFSLELEDEWLGEEKRITFGEFLKHWEKKLEYSQKSELEGNEFFYLASLPMSKWFPELVDDIIPPKWAKIQKKRGNLWMGNSGQITKLHHDHSTGDPGMDGIHFMVEGSKRWLLFDPVENAFTIPRKKVWGRFHQAIVETETGLPSFSKFPNFKKSKCFEIFLKKGESLFIPKCWWHFVHTLEPSIAVNFWFQHLGSEKLKLNEMWDHTVSYLMAVEKMKISPEKMKNVLKFYGFKNPSDEEIENYIKNPKKFMLLPQYLSTFSNGTRAPWIKGEEAEKFGNLYVEKIKKWIEDRIN